MRRREITPTRNPNFVNSQSVQGDRHVAQRLEEDDLEVANYLMHRGPEPTFNTSFSAPTSPAKDGDKEQLLRMMRGKSTGSLTDAAEDERILVYRKSCAPAAPVGHMNQAKVLYSAHAVHPSSSVKKSSRFIPSAPERILDAPDIQDDYYMNIIDWSRNGVVAVALGWTLFLWNAGTGDIQQLFEMDSTNEMLLPTAVKWSKDGKHLGVGFKDGSLRIYDPTRPVPANGRIELRVMRIPSQHRNGVLSWRGGIISAGYQNGEIIHHDVRIPDHITGSFHGHSQEVVGMQWSYDERVLASGSGDKTVRLWDSSLCGERTSKSLFTLDDHIGSVRAVQFCNFKSSMLATGGGLEDKTIKTWNINSGELLKSVSTESAVNSIVFNAEYREMMSAHSTGNLCIWKYPSYSQTALLNGHVPYRALSLAVSPCGQYVMSAGGDETLKTWNVFKVDKSTAKLATRTKLTSAPIR